jgi:hypothetical protein
LSDTGHLYDGPPADKAWQDFISKVRASTKHITSAAPPTHQGNARLHVYFASELRRCFDTYYGDYTDLLAGESRSFKLETSEPAAFMSRCTKELQNILSDMTESLKSIDSSEDETTAVQARKIAQAFGHMLQLTLYLNGVTSSSQSLKDACRAGSAYCRPALVSLWNLSRQMSADFQQFAQDLEAGNCPDKLHFNWVIDRDRDALEKLLAAIGKLGGTLQMGS